MESGETGGEKAGKVHSRAGNERNRRLKEVTWEERAHGTRGTEIGRETEGIFKGSAKAGKGRKSGG